MTKALRKAVMDRSKLKISSIKPEEKKIGTTTKSKGTYL